MTDEQLLELLQILKMIVTAGACNPIDTPYIYRRATEILAKYPDIESDEGYF
jgi:hypothetical protein